MQEMAVEKEEGTVQGTPPKMGKEEGMAQTTEMPKRAEEKIEVVAHTENLTKEQGMAVEAQRTEAQGADAQRVAQDAARRAEQRHMGQRFAALQAQAAAAKRHYSDFSLATECRDPAFLALVLRGLDLQTAYEVRHRDALLQRAMQKACEEAVQQTVADIRMRGLRPQENGLRARGGMHTRRDVAHLTRSEREQIARRVMKGERIRLD